MAKEDFNIMEENNGSGSRSSSETKQTGKWGKGVSKSTIFMGIAIVVLLGFSIGFLAAWLVERSRETVFDDVPGVTTVSTTAPTAPSGSTGTAVPTITTTQATTTPEPIDIYLPRDILPAHYDLTIEPNHEQNTFTGNVIVAVTINQTTSVIKIHAHQLTITEQSVTDSSNELLVIRGNYTDTERQFHVIELNNDLVIGQNYSITLGFIGSLADKTVGYYRTQYIDANNQIRYVSATTMEPTYARQAFPCFDEPNMKATFNISIIHHTNMIAISNGEEIDKVVIDDTRVMTVFGQTVKMSTYLVAFVVSDFQYVESSTVRGRRIRIYTRPDQINKTRYAMDTTTRMLVYFEDLLGSDYQLNKLDLVALPEFFAGAMENWGLVTFRETNLLYDESESSAAEQKRVASVIAHELAHMWFGNLVTMDWWNEIWLNEGFATYNEYRGVNSSESDWMITQFFLPDDLHGAIRLDEQPNTRPIIPDSVTDPDDIMALFDTVSYSKGASVLRMLEGAVGTDVYLNGIKAYLNKYAYSNAKTEYLWQEIENFRVDDGRPGIPIGDYMQPWTKQGGVPVVSVSRTQDNKIRVTQQRFASNSSDQRLWPIYLDYLSINGVVGNYLLTTRSGEFDNVTVDYDNWIKINDASKGYFVTNYELRDWQLLVDLLKSDYTALSPTNRANLIFDATVLATNNLLPYEVFFDLIVYIVNEDSVVPWITAATSLQHINDHLLSSNLFMRSLIRQLTSNIYSTIGWENVNANDEGLQTRILRSTIIDITCGNGNQDCLDEASRRFRVWADNSQTPILPDIRELAYKYGLQQSTSLADFDRVWLRWLAESSPIERAKLLNALANVRDPLLLNQLIAYANDQTIFNSQEFFTVMTSISGNIIGRPIVWNYVRNNWDRLVDRYTINDIRLGNLVYSICQGFMTNTSLNEMLDFFGRTDAGAGSSARERALGIVRENIAWIQTNEQNVSQWLSDNSPDENPWLNWRLDSRVIPLKYDIYWNIDLVNDLFNGSVTITVNTTIPVKYFVLHSSGLQVIAANAFTNSSNEDITDTTRQFFFHTDFEYFVVPLNKLTLPGVYRLYIEFSGNLTTNLDGLYKSTYNTSDGTVKSMVATQMEPTSARKAFPCFDEPQFKSTFVITVNHSSELSVLSNMPIANHYNPTNGTQVTQFQETVKMVTYLVALAVSDFICNRSEQTVGPNYVVISTCAAREQASKMAYSMDRTPKILDFFQSEYFGIEYSLPKLDNIAIPDFGAGAMENWGLVTYREMYLLFDENESTTRDLMIIGEIIAHELAHQWFGNRVTMRWWDDLWLNEGFATYMTYKAVSFVERSWDFDDHFAIEDMNRVMDADSSPKTHPIITGVQNIDDIDAVFDAITYSKGAAVLRMLDRSIGEENFRLGVQNYLNKYAYQNTLSDDLWTELTATSNLNVADVMDTWIRRDGFPVVTITRLSANNYTYMGVRQERFLKDDANSATNYNWVIPLTYKLLGGNVTLTWVRDYETNITLNLTVGSADLIKYNHDQSGIYIVDYPDDEWTKWINALRSGESVINQLTVIDRSQFISDAFYLSRAGRQGYTTPLELSEYLVYENSLIPWTIAKSMFDHIKSLIYNNYEIALNYHLQSLVSPLYNTLGWDDSGDANTRRLRTVIIDIACGYQMEECLTAAKEGFTAFRNGSLIMPNLRLLVLKYGIWQSTDTSDWEFLITKYTETQSAQEKLQYLQGLANTRNVTLIARLLEMASDTNIVRSQDFFTLLRYISYNPYGLPIVWNYYRNNYEQIVNRFTINNSNLGRAVYDFAVYFSTNSRLQEVLDFFAAYPNAGAGKAYRDNALELINGNINWINSYQTTVGQWLTTKCGPQTCPWITYRLNQDIVPVNYNLVVQVNTTTNIFNGSVSIEVDARQEVQYFIVHAADILNITDSQVFVNRTGEAVQVVKTFMYLPLQFWVLQLDRALPPDQYVLTFYFNSNLLLGGLSGLYKSTYQRDNETVGLAATQFQSTSARKAFPCFDEPSFRSVFDITIIHDENRNLTISNMPIVSESTDHSLNWVTTRYEPSVSMVSYLVAMLVSDFACRQENSSDGVIVKVCSTPVKEHMLDYSMQVSPAILQHFVDEFESPFQLPKVDIVAIPDFAAGAMENWGLVKFRESYLLWTRETDTSSSKAGVNAVIAHELAHMWFGNLITCQWWSDLWLNEGFASFWEYTAVNATEPDWDYWQLFLYYDFGSAVNADSSANSMPIVWTIDTPAQTGYSSAIVYNKGATVIRMMKFVMNDTGFREGIRYYLKQNAYKLAVTDDLWESLSGYFPQEYGTNIRDFMNPWIRSAGFPYVNVTKLANNTYRFLQQRFLATGATPSPDTVWQIPLSYYTSYDTRTTKIVLLTQKQQDIVIDDADTGVNGLIKFNTDTTGMYFVNYPLEDWDNWIDALVNNTDNIVSKLTPQDRTGMIIDSFYFQRAQMLPYIKPLQLSRYMVNEDHFTPWALFTSLISQIREYMFTSEYRQFMQSYFSQLAEPQYNRLGWNDSLGSDTEKRLRAVITDFICWNNHKGCLADAVEEFRVWKNGGFIYPNLRTAILRYGIRQSQDRSDWDFLWNAYLAETDSTLRQTYMIALTFTTNPDIIKDFINLALDDRLVPLNEFTSILGYLAGNSDALQIVWEFYQNYYDMLSRKLSAVQLGSVLNSISGYFSNTTRRTEVQNLLNRYSTYGVSSAQRTSAINTITANINWMNTYKDTVGQFFANYSCGSEVCPFAKYRLNTRITPTYYDLLIQVNVTTNVYNGTVKITVNASEDVDYFVVHASSILTVSDSRVYDSTRRQQFGVSQVFRYAPMEYWVVSLNETQRSGVYILEFDFNSNLLLGGLAGLYRSNYTYNNQSYGVASTQFEYTDARKAFPCFDEPTFRTNFTISIVHDAHMNATFSNMPVKNETEDPTSGWVTTYYDESVSMVSYLVAMLVSDYVCGETSTATIESIRICAYRGMEYKFNYALDVTPKIFDQFESYLDSPYQLKKSDLVAIPAFYYGAMENWGLVTFRETALLWHEDEDTSATKMSVNAVIAHELAHQWFGNLVTCQWWSDLWLNEGFASFMEYTAVNASEPDWNYFELFTSDFASAVSSDSTGGAHAIIRTDITADSRITGTSAITYSKGSTVIRMLEFVMDMNNFQTGIQAYLRENAWTSVVTISLWNSLNPYFPSNQYENTTIYEFMNNWTTAPGYPYLNITRNGTTVTVTQQRFLQSGNTPAVDTLWVVPLSYYTSTSSNEIRLIKAKTETIELPESAVSSGLIKFNVDCAGMYFVNYPQEDFDAIVQSLVNDSDVMTRLTSSDRACLIIESFYLQRANLVDYMRPLELSRYMSRENHFSPWNQFNSFIAQIRNYMFITEYKRYLNSYLINLAEPTYNALKWNDTDGSDTTKRLRSLIVEFICWNYHEQCLNDAYAEFTKFRNGAKLAPNLRTSILRYGIRAGTADDLDFLFNRYVAETTSLKSTYLNALTYTRDQTLIVGLITRSMEERFVSTSDFTTLLQNLAANYDALQIVWEFYQNNYEVLVRKLSANQLSNVMTTICGYFSTVDRRTEVQNFFAKFPNIGLTTAQRNSAINAINNNINWMNQYKERVGQWLVNQVCTADICPWTVYRLNQQIVPINYNLVLQVNVTTNIYNGTVTIEVEAQHDVQYFMVHTSSILTVTDSRVLNGGQQIPVVDTFRYQSLEFWVVQVDRVLTAGTYSLQFSFTGNLLLGGLVGIYRSNYTDTNGEQIGLAATQFQDVYARSAFPCFDEPSFKSTFEVTLVHDAHMNATLANMPVASEYTEPVMNWTITRYEKTVPMVTYLVAMVVSDFVCAQTATTNGTLVRICASRVQQHKMDYALVKTPIVIDHFNVYLDYEYQLPKSDLVAIPDFSFGAMENWGLVTFRESALLWHEDDSTSTNKMSVIAIIAHELAHMWFGNLVTCQWWSDLWLNEGFASYMEYTSVDAAEPDWGYWHLFMIFDYGPAVSADSSETSQALTRPVNTPSQMAYQSAIIYQKGATVLRMIEFVMTSANFQTGLQQYLKKFQYNNTVNSDLVESLAAAFPSVNVNPTQFLESWTTQPGFPYLNITITGNTVDVVQERFLSNGQTPATDTLYVIPLSYYTSFDTLEYNTVYITEKQQTFTLNGVSDNTLIKFNPNANGMYFINYPMDYWDNWIHELMNTQTNTLNQLTPSDRTNFILDAFYLSRADRLPYTTPLKLSQYLVRETHLTPWTLAISMFDQIRKFIYTTDYKTNLNVYLTRLAKPQYDLLGWNDTEGNDVTKRLRSQIVEFICSLDYTDCLLYALDEYGRWKSGQFIAPNLLTSTLRYGIRQSSDPEDWNFLWNTYVNEQSATLRLTYLNALSYTTNTSLITLLLNRSFDESLVRSQDFLTVINNIIGNPDGRQLLWNFYKQHYDLLANKLTQTQMGTVLNNICGYFTTEESKLEVQYFFGNNTALGVSETDKRRALETIDSNIDWMAVHREEVGEWLNDVVCGENPCPWSVYRLNENIIPIKYWLTIQVNTTTNVFNGSVTIEVQANQSVDYFIVHAANILSVGKSQIFVNSTNEAIPVVNSFRYSALEFWVIQPNRTLETDTYRLVIDFNSNLLLGGLVGLYKSSYVRDNQTIGVAATQYEATHARKAFPCFDEPAFRSIFETTLIHDAEKTLTITNMPIASETVIANGWVETRYEPSVEMVTYLNAIVVSDFVCNNTYVNGSLYDYNVGICSSPVQAYKNDYALEKTPLIFEHFEQYLDSGYQLPKSDLVAIPDFSAGAMENWGLMLYRETALLWHTNESTSTNKMSVIAVIAHEIAHMWFGNLVTCKWWSDLWLNEGFASFMEYTAVDYAEPDWNYWDLFIIFDYGTAVNVDSSATTHPIVRNVSVPAQMTYTSAILYQKGATVIRMLEYVMNKTRFQQGIQNYLEENEWTSIQTPLLWQSLDPYFPTEYDTNVLDFMDSWTLQAGFPYLNITRNGNSVTVTQQRFLQSGQQPENDTLWVIPLSYYTSLDQNTSKIEFIKTKEETITVEANTTANGLIKFNADAMGFYLVNYPEEDWNGWINVLNDNSDDTLFKLTPSDRTNFIIDSFYLSRANLLRYTIPLELSSYLRRETHLTPWTIAISMFDPLQKYMLTTEYRDDLQAYLSGIAEPIYTQLGWNDSAGNDVVKRLRSSVVEFICFHNYGPCRDRAYDEFTAWKSGGFIAPNLLTTTLKYGIRSGGISDDWDYVWDVYSREQSAVLQLAYLNALSFTTNTTLISLLLNRSLDVTLIRSQDFVTVLNYVAANNEALETLWQFYQNNYLTLSTRLSVANLGNVLNNICVYFSDNTRRAEVVDFLGRYATGLSDSDRVRVLETIDNNIKWMDEHKEEVGQWLRTKVSPWTVFRLNENVIPKKYELYIQVNLTTNVYNGTVSIDVDVNERVDYIKVHAANIVTITDSRVYINSTGEQLAVDNAFSYAANDFWVLRTRQTLAPNSYKLVFDFNGDLLLGGLVGLYRSNYTNSANESIGLAVTKFTQINARKAFPCFDEPAFRSVFDTTVVHDPEKTLTIGNMPIANETVIDNGWVATRFEPSVEMVTYLDAFIVSDFECAQTNATYFPIRVCSAPQLTYKSGYALEVTPKIFDHFEAYLGHDYQLPKCDIIALPQYSAGATEKWGIVLFLDNYVLWDENENTATNKMTVAAIIAHEMAHMWFGNLITCKWWSDLWLNEGFASYLEYTSVNASEPDWGYWDIFLMFDYYSAVNADSSPTSHPIVREVNSNAAVTSYTSAIIYQKGSTVLRMLEFVMRTENFRAGLQRYLTDNEWKSIETPSLWLALSDSFPSEYNTTIYEFIDPWVTKAGFPYINITRNANTVSFTQQRYLSNGQPPAIDTVWEIPLTYYTAFDTQAYKIEIIKTKQFSTTIEDADQSLNGLIKFNINSNGMYIVNYPQEDWNNWSDVLTRNTDNIVTKLTPSDRTNFLIDSLFLSRANLVPYLTPLNMSRYLVNERHLTPWTIAINNVFTEVQRYVSITDEYKQDLRTYFSSLAQPVYNNLRWNDSDGTVITQRLRSLIVEFICGNYHLQCLSDALVEFRRWRSGERIGPNLLQSALRYGMRQSNQTDDWYYLWNAYTEQTSQTVQLNYLNALSYTTDSSLINELLYGSLNTSLIPSQYFVNLLNYIAANSDGLELVWGFYQNNYLVLTERLTVTNLGNVLNTICGYFGDDRRKTEVQNFLNQYPNTGLSSSDRLRVIRTIDDNISWMSARKDLVGNWLRELNSNTN